MSSLRCFAALLFAGHVLCCGARAANAADCSPATGISPCFEADALRLPAGAARFAGFPAPLALPAGQAAFTLGTGWVHEPVILNAPSPSVDGRDIPVVENEVGVTMATAVGLGHALELSFVFPLVLAREGSGVEGVTAQSAPALKSSTVRDPRVGATFTPFPLAAARPWGLKARLELSLPMGDEAALAGYAGPALIPAVDAELELGRFAVGAEISGRFGEAVDFATTRQGSELGAALGVAFSILRDRLLEATLEGWLRQGLSTPDDASSTVTTRGPAAEWLAGLSSKRGPYSVLLGAGTGLPLATERRSTLRGETSTNVFAPTAPAARVLLLLRFAPAIEQ